MNNSSTEIAIANEFSRILREWLTADQMEAINKSNHESNFEGGCASHEYCDPNEAMLEAFEIATGNPWDFDGNESVRNAEMELMNSAWDLAMKNNYQPL